MDPKDNLARLDAPGPATDLELARRVASGDHDALRLMMRQHNQTLFRTARSILRDDHEAEDVVQEGYLLAYRSIGDFRGDARLSTWLIRIVVNLAIRRKQRQTRDASLRTDGVDEEVQEMTQSPSPGPETAASTAELRRLLETHIDRLPDLYREVFVLRGVEELDVDETAAALGIPEATVRTRYFRARHLLREGLAQDIDFAIGDAFSFAGDRCDRIVAGVFKRLQEQDFKAPISPHGETS